MMHMPHESYSNPQQPTFLHCVQYYHVGGAEVHPCVEVLDPRLLLLAIKSCLCGGLVDSNAVSKKPRLLTIADAGEIRPA